MANDCSAYKQGYHDHFSMCSRDHNKDRLPPATSKFKPVTEREKLAYQLDRIATALENLAEQGRASIGIATLGDLMDNHISNKEFSHMKSYQEIPDADNIDIDELEDRCD